MLTSTTIHLRALGRGELPNTTGQLGHAAFLRLIESVAPELAQALHDNNGRQPFTVSPLQVSEPARSNGPSSPSTGVYPEVGRPRGSSGLVLREGDSYSMRFTVLDSTLFQSFQRAFMAPDFTATIRLRNVPLLIEEVRTTENNAEWTGYTTFEQLRDCARSEHTLALRFESPTAISFNDSAGKKFDLLPTPWRVFDSLCRKWNAFAEMPIAEPEELHAWVDAHGLVAGHSLHTAALRFDRFPQIGFVGSVVYETKSADGEMVRTLNALADFALYAGVGYKTTMGMGQARRIVA